MQYTVDYFIDKFEKIPEELWCVESFTIITLGQSCALGHCGYSDFENIFNSETESLSTMFLAII
jgi:hypothetical protein